MRTHAKASSAGSTERQASGLAFPATLVAALAFLAFAAAPAGAVIPRPFLENFGSAEEQTFTEPQALAVDQASGDLLVTAGFNNGTISRFDEEGVPSNFSGLGTNMIDGRKGPGGKPCAEEPASCDAVPRGELQFFGGRNTNVVIDESGGPTDGNIYVPQVEGAVVYIFAADGHYLGQLGGFSYPCGVGVDSDGTVYVGDLFGAIAKYTPSGSFPVDGDRSGTLEGVTEPCTLSAGIGATAGSLFVTRFFDNAYKLDANTGAIDYQLAAGPTTTSTVDPASGHVFVAAGNEVTEYDASGATKAVRQTTAQSAFEVTGIAVNSAKNLLYLSNEATGKVEVFGPPPLVPEAFTGAVSNLTGSSATLNATVNPQGSEVEDCFFEWGETSAPYEHTAPCAESAAEIGEGNSLVSVHADISGLSGAGTYHYRIAAANSLGSNQGDDETFFTPAPPLISEESVQSASRTEATLSFQVNPRSFATSYHLEYGLAGQPYEQSTAERGVGADGTDHALTVTLEGLTPGTAYHWRVVATNLDPAFPGTGTTTGAERRFRTAGTLVPNTSCPNQAFRTGAAAALPDCRAYEMVSPVDKNGGDITGFRGFSAAEWTGRAAYDQAALDGNKLTYSAGTPFGDTVAGRNANQYMATRGTGGWSTHSLNAPGGHIVEQAKNISYTLDPAYTLFTPDLSEAWMQDARIPPLTADAVQGMPNLYRRDNLSESYEALTNEEPAIRPEGLDSLGYLFRMRGHSSDFSDVLFDVGAWITQDAFPINRNSQTYVSADGGLHLVAIRPDGSPYRTGNVGAALSADGSRAYWAASPLPFTPNQGVFLRENPAQPQSAQALGSARGTGDLTEGSNEVTGVSTASGAFAVGQDITSERGDLESIDHLPTGTKITAVGPGSLTLSANAELTQPNMLLFGSSECTEPDKACTIPVSATAPGPPTMPGAKGAEFGLASADGSKALFQVVVPFESNAPKDLYEFDANTRTSTLIAHESKGVVGASKDASRVYFVSEEDLAAGASEGELNLYLREEGVETFIATLSADDVIQVGGSTAIIIGVKGQERGNRVSADGSHLLFMSESKELAEEVAGYDNTDAVSGKADREVYLYEVGSGLRCISCNPSGARPVGQRMQQSFDIAESSSKVNIWAAAWIPGWEHQLLAQRVMSDDGSRVFFNAFDALVPGDTNGTLDVYQWELPGAGDCTTANPTYSEQNGGCLSLISSGQSPQTSEFIDASADGRDVFFTTGSSLLPQDPGLVDMYDARVEGGFPQPPAPPAICEGEACQGAPTPPNDPTPASAAYNGPGNVNEAAAKKKSKKHKHKKKNKHKKQKKKGGKSKRQAADNSTRRNG